MAARNKGSLSQQVAKQLLSDFQEGVRYRPGDKLPNENDLAGEYGVSRGTLREAIRILSSHGCWWCGGAWGPLWPSSSRKRRISV